MISTRRKRRGTLMWNTEVTELGGSDERQDWLDAYGRKREKVEGLDGVLTHIASHICGPLRNGSWGGASRDGLVMYALHAWHTWRTLGQLLHALAGRCCTEVFAHWSLHEIMKKIFFDKLNCGNWDIFRRSQKVMINSSKKCFILNVWLNRSCPCFNCSLVFIENYYKVS